MDHGLLSAATKSADELRKEIHQLLARANAFEGLGVDYRDKEELKGEEAVTMQLQENINLHGDEINVAHSPTSSGKNSVVAL